MFCRNCGQPVREGASFCGSCGEPVARQPEQGTVQAASPVTHQPVQQNPQRPNPQPPHPAPNQPPRYPQQQPNPQFRQNAAPVNAVPPPIPPQMPPATQSGNQNPALIAVIVFLFILVLISGVLLFIKPGYLVHRDGGSGGVPTLNGTEHTFPTDSTVTTAVIADGSTQTAPAAVTATQSVPEDAQGMTDVPQEMIGGGNPWMLSTNERPVLGDFEWCVGQFGFIRQAPEDAELISDVQGYTGGWKAMIIYNPDDPNGIFTRELDNIYIGVYDDNRAEVTIDWYLLVPDYSEISNLEDMEDTLFTGGITNTGISANGPALISLDSFWNSSGRQYALGSLTMQDGTNAYLAMVRP